MIKLLEFLFTGKWACTHKWETFKEHILTTRVDEKKEPFKIEYLYVLRCIKCGELTSKTIEVGEK